MVPRGSMTHRVLNRAEDKWDYYTFLGEPPPPPPPLLGDPPPDPPDPASTRRPA